MADLEPTPTATIQYPAISGVADLEPTPTALTIQYAPLSAVTSATAEHVVMVGMLGSGGSNSTVVASNMALESRDQSRPKYAEDATKLDVIASPDSREQVSELCRYVCHISSLVLYYTSCDFFSTVLLDHADELIRQHSFGKFF